MDDTYFPDRERKIYEALGYKPVLINDGGRMKRGYMIQPSEGDILLKLIIMEENLYEIHH